MPVVSGNLPAEPNSFVGRERDLAELALLLGEVRALTLCGPGGIGKTRLAVRLSCELSADYPEGAWLVELADTTDPELVVRRVAATMGVREEPDRPLAQTVTEALRDRSLLIILDTCEHLVGACAALVRRMLAGCPWVRVIATSREPLRVRGETVWRVPPLSLPATANGSALSDLASHEAMRLFSDRASAARTGFTLGSDNAGAVARLCRTLDGMPLAIELAAARVRALSVEQIADRLDDRFRLLASGDRTAPARQQTLRAAVDWSYELLTEAEQVLLRRLAVFAGWNMEMAEQVCADELIPASSVLDLVAALIDKSLVIFEHEVYGDSRYRLLDTIKEYAATRLSASGEEPDLRARHSVYLLRTAEAIVEHAFVRGPPSWPWRVTMYRRLTADLPNYRLALAFALERGDAEQGLRLCGGLRNPWVTHGDATEGGEWLDRFLTMPGPVSDALRGRALTFRGDLAFEQQDYATTERCAIEGLQLCRRSGDPHEAAAMRLLALVSLGRRDLAEAAGRISEALATARELGEDWEEGLALSIKAAITVRQGGLREAQRTYEAALDVLRDNNGWGVAQVRYGLGAVARARGDYRAATGHFRDALALYTEIDARPEIARCLAGIGWVALAEGDFTLGRTSLTDSLELSLATGQRLPVARGLEAFASLAAKVGDAVRAARLAGAAVELRSASGQAPSAGAGARLDDLLNPARRLLGQAAAAALLAEGRAMTPAEAISYAMAEQPEAPGDQQRRRGRESTAQEPAGQVAAGPGDGGAGTGGAGTAGPESPPRVTAALLTRREREIAGLIARGLGNRAIADELFISQATVARHVANMLVKLGFNSRAQVAAWMVARGAEAGP
ncbi:MAG TPA: LuxR C-terminal-related transcriptional regulator [Streptosporangiaceae bacterium]|nr:LuxR C-terminal-related transcriptional regulator [Streptosporangiaceae bacterium]